MANIASWRKAVGLSLLMGTAAAANAESLVWTGCGISKTAFMADVAGAYKEKTGVDILITGGGATKGIRSVAAGKNQLGGSCRYRLRNAGGEVLASEEDARLTQVAWDAIVAVTHPSNPVSSLSMAQLRGIYAGEITNWKQLGGHDQAIELVIREGKESGVGHMFRKLVMGDADFDFPAASTEVRSSGPLETKVEQTPAALAVDGISSARKRDLKILALDGVKPTKANIAKGRYKLFRPLYIVTDDINATPKAIQFVEFLLSEEGQAVISRAGTVNLAEGAGLNARWSADAGTMAR